MSDNEIVLTEQQEKCVNFSEAAPLIVKGIAGSGKSLVIITRALMLYEKHASENPRIAIFTFANSLVKFTNEFVEKLGYDPKKFTISTIDREIIKLYNNVMPKHARGNNIFDIDYDVLSSAINSVKDISDKESRFFDKNMAAFLGDEIRWMKEHFLSSFEEYYSSPRTGRGTVRLSFGDKQLIFEIYDKYYKILKENEKNKLEVMYEDLYNKRNLINDFFKYDYVLIDECQDLPLSKLKIAKELAKKSITFSADFTQKIYKTGFTWKEIGIQISGNSSKTLTGTFRNTYEIMNFASDFVKHNNDLLEFIPPELPERHGSLPQLFIMKNEIEKQNSNFIKMVRYLLSENIDDTLGVIVADNRRLFRLYSLFENNNIDCQIIKKKEDYDVLTPGIKLVTFHSAKGLEFDTVLLPYLDDGVLPNLSKVTSEEEKVDAINNARNLLYVGMTRAKHNLYMLCGNNPSILIKDFNDNLVKIKTVIEIK